MTWYIVGIITVAETINGNQAQYPINEDLMLYQAHSKDELDKKIKDIINLHNEIVKDGITYYNESAIDYYIGIRQINAFNQKPADGNWIYHSEMKVKSWQEVLLLADGKAVEVQFLAVNNNKEVSE